MKITLNKEQFIYEFNNSSRGGNFTREALEELYDYFEMCEYDEFDPVAIDCEFSERTLDDIKADYNDIDTIDDLHDKTYAVELDNGNILFNYNF